MGRVWTLDRSMNGQFVWPARREAQLSRRFSRFDPNRAQVRTRLFLPSSPIGSSRGRAEHASFRSRHPSAAAAEPPPPPPPPSLAGVLARPHRADAR